MVDRMTARMNADRLTISSGAASDLFKLQSEGDNQRNSSGNNDSHQRLNTSASSFNSSFNSCDSDGVDESPIHPRMTVLTRANTTSSSSGLPTKQKMAPNRAKSAPIQPVRRKCSLDYDNDSKRVNYYDSPNKLPQSPATPTSTTSSPSHLTSYLARLAAAKQQFNKQQVRDSVASGGVKSAKTGSSSNDGILLSPVKDRGSRKKDSSKPKRSSSKHRRGSVQRAKSAPASSPTLSRKKKNPNEQPPMTTRRRYSSPLADFMSELFSDAESRHGLQKLEVSLEQDNATIPKADTDSATTTPIASNTSSPDKVHSDHSNDRKEKMVHVLGEVRHVSKARQESDRSNISKSAAVAVTTSSDRRKKMIDVLDEVRHVSKARQEVPFYHCRWSPYVMVGEEAIMTSRSGSKNDSKYVETTLRQRNEFLAEVREKSVRRRNSNTSTASSVTVKTHNTTTVDSSRRLEPRDETRQRRKCRWSSSP